MKQNIFLDIYVSALKDALKDANSLASFNFSRSPGTLRIHRQTDRKKDRGGHANGHIACTNN